MKNLIILATLLLSMSANARSIIPLSYVLQAPLTEAMNIDQDSPLSQMNILNGRVLVKQIEREIVLELFHVPICAPGMACPEVLYTEEIKLPLVKQFVDDCNNTIYVAERNMMPADGTHDVLVVADHTTNMCPTFVALPETGISFEVSFYDRINGGLVSTYSTFEAGKLKGRVLPTADLEKVLPALK